MVGVEAVVGMQASWSVVRFSAACAEAMEDGAQYRIFFSYFSLKTMKKKKKKEFDMCTAG